MNRKNHEALGSQTGIIHYGYLATIFFITLSGFGQMPIFKRFYIADIPGLGWLAKFYITHTIHYGAAALLLGISAYRITDYLLLGRKKLKLSPSGYLRGVLIIGLIVTGILLVIRNFEGNVYSHNFIIFLDLTHLSLVILFLLASLICFIFKKKWIVGHKQH